LGEDKKLTDLRVIGSTTDIDCRNEVAVPDSFWSVTETAMAWVSLPPLPSETTRSFRITFMPSFRRI
jgi:hypothetical protein